MVLNEWKIILHRGLRGLHISSIVNFKRNYKWKKTQNKQFPPLIKVLCGENCCFCYSVFAYFVLLVGFYLLYVFCVAKISSKKN